MATGIINDTSVQMLVDGESMISIMSNGISIMSNGMRKKLNLPIRVDGDHYLKGIQGPKTRLLGICENVKVKIGGISLPVHFFVTEKSSQEVLLGQGFLVQSRAAMQYSADGSVEMTISKEGKVVRIEVTAMNPSNYLRHVPGEKIRVVKDESDSEEDDSSYPKATRQAQRA